MESREDDAKDDKDDEHDNSGDKERVVDHCCTAANGQWQKYETERYGKAEAGHQEGQVEAVLVLLAVWVRVPADAPELGPDSPTSVA